jgi:hypothetical protein
MAATTGEPWSICDNTGNYSTNSRYQANIDILSSTLPTKASSSPLLFAMSSVGAAPDTVYGLALCRGDANASTCLACVAAAFPEARQRCAHNKEAVVFYDTCLLLQ